VAQDTDNSAGAHYVNITGSGVTGYRLSVTNNDGATNGLTITQINTYEYRVDFDADIPYGAQYKILAQETLSQ